mmetsp:Transcript_4928/g.17123  ORF Transcript_4928/g.17123 Transcript_4928/m.17123 type:complete len:394 (+) Transcript_4928:93-1274(+)
MECGYARLWAEGLKAFVGAKRARERAQSLALVCGAQHAPRARERSPRPLEPAVHERKDVPLERVVREAVPARKDASIASRLCGGVPLRLHRWGRGWRGLSVLRCGRRCGGRVRFRGGGGRLGPPSGGVRGAEYGGERLRDGGDPRERRPVSVHHEVPLHLAPQRVGGEGVGRGVLLHPLARAPARDGEDEMWREGHLARLKQALNRLRRALRHRVHLEPALEKLEGVAPRVPPRAHELERFGPLRRGFVLERVELEHAQELHHLLVRFLGGLLVHGDEEAAHCLDPVAVERVESRHRSPVAVRVAYSPGPRGPRNLEPALDRVATLVLAALLERECNRERHLRRWAPARLVVPLFDRRLLRRLLEREDVCRREQPQQRRHPAAQAGELAREAR